MTSKYGANVSILFGELLGLNKKGKTVIDYLEAILNFMSAVVTCTPLWLLQSTTILSVRESNSGTTKDVKKAFLHQYSERKPLAPARTEQDTKGGKSKPPRNLDYDYFRDQALLLCDICFLFHRRQGLQTLSDSVEPVWDFVLASLDARGVQRSMRSCEDWIKEIDPHSKYRRAAARGRRSNVPAAVPRQVHAQPGLLIPEGDSVANSTLADTDTPGTNITAEAATEAKAKLPKFRPRRQATKALSKTDSASDDPVSAPEDPVLVADEPDRVKSAATRPTSDSTVSVNAQANFAVQKRGFPPLCDDGKQSAKKPRRPARGCDSVKAFESEVKSNIWDDALRAAESLSVAEGYCRERMDGTSELRPTMRRRPLRVWCRALVPSASKDFDHGHALAQHTTKVVHLVQDGHGFHNLMSDLYREEGRSWTQFVPSPDNPYTRVELTDCPLTEVGRQQAEALQGRVLELRDARSGPKLVVSSPHTRALQTALLAFQPLQELGRAGEADSLKGCNSEHGVPFVAHELLREETGVHLCDKRRPASKLCREFEPHFDLGLLPENDQLFHVSRRETKEEVGDRVYRFLEWLEARPEPNVFVSSHSVWLQTLLNGVCEIGDDDPSVMSSFQMGEMRSVEMHFLRAGPK